MNFPRLQRTSINKSQKGFVPESLKEMKRASSCRKFNLGALSTPQAVKKMLSISRLTPNAPTLSFGMGKEDDRRPRASSTPRGGGRSELPIDLVDKTISSQNTSDRRTSLLSRQTSLVGMEFQAPTPTRRRRSSSVGVVDGAMGMSLSLSSINRRSPAATRTRTKRSVSTEQMPRVQSSRRLTRQSSGLRTSPRGLHGDTKPTRKASRSRPFTPNSRGSSRRQRRSSLGARDSKQAPLVSDLDDGLSDNGSLGGISIDETVNDLQLNKGRRDSKSPSTSKRSSRGLDKYSNLNSSASRRISCCKGEDKRMSRSSHNDPLRSGPSKSKSRSSDHSAFCTPRRTILKAMEMSQGDMSAVTMVFDEISIDDKVVCNRKKQHGKVCRSKSAETEMESSRSRPTQKAVELAKEEMVTKGKTPKKKLPRRSKTHDASTATALKIEIAAARDDKPRLPARSKSFSLKKAKEERQGPVLTVRVEAMASPSPIETRRSSTKRTASKKFKNSSREVTPDKPDTNIPSPTTAATTINSTSDRPPVVVEADTIDIHTKMDSFPCGYEEELVPCPTKACHITPAQTWRCTCGYEADKIMKCCGMCGTKQHWTCTGCQVSDNLCIFAFCGMCGDSKSKGEKRSPHSPASVMTLSA